MLQIAGMQRLSVNGRSFTAWKDDQEFDLFYVLPNEPRLRIENGRPVFQYLRYRTPVNRGQGGEVGGLCVFDVDLAISEQDLAGIKTELRKMLQIENERRARSIETLVLAYLAEGADSQGQWREQARNLRLTPPQVRGFAEQYGKAQQPTDKWQIFLVRVDDVKIGNIPFTRGNIMLNLQSLSTDFVERVWSSGRPSLFGNNLATFTAELSQNGSKLFWDVLRNGSGGVISVAYELWCSAILPPVEVSIVYNHAQHRKISESKDATIATAWGTQQRETLTEEFFQSGVADVKVYIPQSFRDEQAEEAKALEERLREWGLQRLEEAITRQVKPDFDKVGQRFSSDKGSYLVGVNRSDVLKSATDISETFRQMSAIEYLVNAAGTLAPLKTLTGADGQRMVPDADLSTYFREVDLDDVFSQRLEVGVNVNADFKALNLFDVQVKIEYPGAAPQELRFTDNTEKNFVAFVSRDQQSGQVLRDYTYSYEINYRGKSQRFRSESQKANDTSLTIGVDDVGMFLVDGVAQGVDWAHIDRALVTVRYNDPARNVRIPERPFMLDAANPRFSITEPIFAPRDMSYEYKVTYYMPDGSEFSQDWRQHDARQFFLLDPFTARQIYTFSVVGLSPKDQVALNLSYGEEGSGYTQKRSMTINSTTPEAGRTWRLPAIEPKKSRLTYEGFIQYEGGAVENIPATLATSNMIVVGNVVQDTLAMEISAENLDFTQRFRSLIVNLEYSDPPNRVLDRKSFTFRDESRESWDVRLKDESRRSFRWQIVAQMYSIGFGENGRVFLPGPTRNDWGADEAPMGTFTWSLDQQIPSDEDLARRQGLLLVRILPAGIDWMAVDEIRLMMQYERDSQSFRITEDNAEAQAFLFLSKRGASAEYSWSAEFRMDDGRRVRYPERGTASASASELALADFAPAELAEIEPLLLDVNADHVDFDSLVKSLRVNLRYNDPVNRQQESKSFTFNATGSEQWEVARKSNISEYRWQALVQLHDLRLGNRGRLVLPGPDQSDWGSDELSPLDLAEKLPTLEALAQEAGLRLVTISTEGIDWAEIETIVVDLEYGPAKQAFRINQENGENRKFYFLAPQRADASYSWRAQFTMDNRERSSYPERGKATSSEEVLRLNNYVLQEYGGDLEPRRRS